LLEWVYENLRLSSLDGNKVGRILIDFEQTEEQTQIGKGSNEINEKGRTTTKVASNIPKGNQFNDSIERQTDSFKQIPTP
jgi:hypothetical protein